MPVIQNISVPAGDDVEIVFNLDDDTVIDFAAASNIVWCVYAQQYGVADGDALFQKTIGDGLAANVSPPDVFTVTLNGTDTSGLAAGNYYHEAFVKDVNGKKSTITVGIFTLTENKISRITT